MLVLAVVMLIGLVLETPNFKFPNPTLLNPRVSETKDTEAPNMLPEALPNPLAPLKARK